MKASSTWFFGEGFFFLAPTQTKHISPWNPVYLELWVNNRNQPRVRALKCGANRLEWRAGGRARVNKRQKKATAGSVSAFGGWGGGQQGTAWNWFCRVGRVTANGRGVGAGQVGGVVEGQQKERRRRGSDIKIAARRSPPAILIRKALGCRREALINARSLT